MSDIKPCDLCSLNVEVSGFQLNTMEGLKTFCCEGCKGIYALLNEEQILADTESTNEIEQ